MEKKYVCKHCFKRFPCGKSLGGHIRTHSEERTSSAVAVAVAHNNNDAAFNFNLKLDGAAGRRKKRDLWSDSDANSIYGLRENPKKTMRFVHSDPNPPAAAAAATLEQHEVEEKFCKECGKGFPSLKALCGHMACHSDKDKKINNNTKVVVMDNTSSQSDTTETCVPRRSKRFKSLTLSNHKNINEVEQEVQDGAMCLILLSKDPNFNYMDHFVLHSKSPSFDTNKIEFRNGTTSNFGGEKKLIKDIKLKSVEFGGFEDYRSKYNNVNAFNKFTMKDDSVGDNLVDKRENDWKYERLVSESYDDDDDDSADYESDEKSSESDSYDSKAVMMNGKKKKNSKVKKKLKLKSKKSSKEHECPICYRIFKSGQALGGHKRSHFVGGNEENTLVIKQAAVPCLIDLNLPAPVDE